MSYDILVFDPAATTDADFEAWWADQAEWSEDHSYNDPTVTTPALRAFFDDMRATFPPMNGPHAATDDEIEATPGLEDRLADYSIGTRLVYGAFAWSHAQPARDLVLYLAAEHGVAVALVSDSDEIIRPA